MLAVTKLNFETEVEQFKGLAVLDFWAPWCGPCRMLGPIFEELAEEYANNASIKFAKINTDEDPELARKFRIRGIPTIKFIKNGKEVDQQVGAVPKEVIKEFISKHI